MRGVVDCPQSLACDMGECVDDPCNGVMCADGESCLNGECVEWLVWDGIIWSSWTACVADTPALSVHEHGMRGRHLCWW